MKLSAITSKIHTPEYSHNISDAGQGNIDFDVAASEAELVPSRHMAALELEVMCLLPGHCNLQRLTNCPKVSSETLQNR